MIRFAWLQARTQTLAALALLAALAVAAAVTGIQLAHLYNTLVAHCQTGCGFAIGRFLSHETFMDRLLDVLARVVPALLGIFWGAPLVAREFENGTHRLAWTQTVSRSRWVLTRLALGAVATVTVAGLLTLTITWWYRAHDKVGTTPFAVFDRRDIAPISYALFAFAAGALIGAVLRRAVPAMAATLGVFAFVRIAVSVWLRPHLMAPVRATLSLLGSGPSAPAELGLGSENGSALTLFARGGGPPGSWTLSSHLVTNSGQRVSSSQVAAFLHQHCANLAFPPPAKVGSGVVRATVPDGAQACLTQAGRTFRLLVTYQPANRFWPFQWLEVGVFVALALLAAAGCYWWVTRRSS